MYVRFRCKNKNFTYDLVNRTSQIHQQLSDAMILFYFNVFYTLVTLQVMGTYSGFECAESGSLTWSSSKNYTKDGGANFYFDYDFFQVCSIKIDADLTLWNNDVFQSQPNLTLSENGVFLNVSVLHRISINDIRNRIRDALSLNYDTEHLLNCSKCIVSLKFGNKYASDSKRVKRVAIKSVSRAISVHPMEERVVKGPTMLYLAIGALVLIMIGSFIPLLILTWKGRANNTPSTTSTNLHERCPEEPTYVNLIELRGGGYAGPVYVNTQRFVQDEVLYDDVSKFVVSKKSSKESSPAE